MSVFENKVAVITGAGFGIGRALALQLAKQGARLAISDINEQTLNETVSLIGPDVEARAYTLDVSDRVQVFQHAEDVKKDFGQVDYVFNNAGVTVSATIEHHTIEEYEWLLGINLWGVIYGTKAFLPMMLEHDSGHIVNISSVFGFVAVPTQSAYHISKFGVRGFTECLSREMEGCNVFATCVHPGGIKTDIAGSARMGANADQTEQDFLNNMQPVLKTTADDCARVILKGVAKRKRRIVVGENAKILDLLPRIFPSSYGPILRTLKGF